MMNDRVLLFLLLGCTLYVFSCSKPPQAGSTKSMSQEESQVATPDPIKTMPVQKLSVLPGPIRQVEVIYDKKEIEKLVANLERADQDRKPPLDISVRPNPKGLESVFYKGTKVFEGKNVEHCEVASNGAVIILAQLTGELSLPGAGNGETEGSAGYIDPIGVWLAVGGAPARRMTPPNVFANNAIFSPNGTKFAIAEQLRGENRVRIESRVRVVDVATGKSIFVARPTHGGDDLFVSQWKSELRVQIITVGEAAYNQAAIYETHRFNRCMRLLLIANLLLPATIHAAPDAVPLPKQAPTEAEILLRLKTAKSPQDQSAFFEMIQTAIQERKVDWLLAAASNPDKTLRMHALHRTTSLPKTEASQLWGTLLTDAQWELATKDLNRDDRRTFQIMAEEQVAKVTGQRPKGDFSKPEFRSQMRPQLQKSLAP